MSLLCGYSRRRVAEGGAWEREREREGEKEREIEGENEREKKGGGGERAVEINFIIRKGNLYKKGRNQREGERRER